MCYNKAVIYPVKYHLYLYRVNFKIYFYFFEICEVY